MKKFQNARVYLTGRGIERRTVLFDERIRALSEGDGEEISLPDDAIVLPGFIDGHIHGAGGADTMDGTAEAISTIARTLVGEGTTSFLATTMTQSPEAIERALSAVAAVKKRGTEGGARLLGAHLEGPFISEKHKGAQPGEYVAPPEVSVFERYDRAAEGNLRVVTLAPEKEGAEVLIDHLKKRGVVASVGHTSAAYCDVCRAIEHGANRITHTFNAQSPLHHREIGVVGSALLFDELYTELIADTIHVSVPAIRLLVKCKKEGKLVLITDAIRAKGLGDGVSELGGQTVYVNGGEARLRDGTLAGSVLRMNEAVRNLAEKAGTGLAYAVDCATRNAAESLGILSECGTVECGKRADFAVVDSRFEVLLTVVGGEVVYRARA